MYTRRQQQKWEGELIKTMPYNVYKTSAAEVGRIDKN
jgi:hypothetical protein